MSNKYGDLSAEDCNELLLDVVFGRKSRLQTPGAKKMRAALEQEYAQAKQKGLMLMPLKVEPLLD